jgi:hypothetical protein
MIEVDVDNLRHKITFGDSNLDGEQTAPHREPQTPPPKSFYGRRRQQSEPPHYFLKLRGGQSAKMASGYGLTGGK